MCCDPAFDQGSAEIVFHFSIGSHLQVGCTVVPVRVMIFFDLFVHARGR
jgi:hypothetical protein